MGYPMTYPRVISRNSLQGDYAHGHTCPTCKQFVQANHEEHKASLIRGDLRRLENDQQDARHLEQYASLAGVTPEQAKAILSAFFEGKF